MFEYEIPDGAGGMKDVVGLFNHDNLQDLYLKLNLY